MGVDYSILLWNRRPKKGSQMLMEQVPILKLLLKIQNLLMFKE